jgi:LysM repeat protein
MKKIKFISISVIAIFLLAANTTAAQKTHVVKQGETLYSISKTYGIPVSEIASANQFKTTDGIKIGQLLQIPVSGQAAVAPIKTAPTQAANARVHTVTKGETVYAICKKYGVSVTEVKQWNSLTDLNLKLGQKLIVSKLNNTALYKPRSVPSTPDTQYQEEDVRPRTTSIVEKTPANIQAERSMIEVTTPVKSQPVTEVTETLKTTSTNPVEYPTIFNQYSLQGYKMKKNRGTANYILAETSGNQNLAFFNDAETGSIIRITNLMNQRTIFVKVMGKVPPTDASQEVMLKLTSKAAQELGAEDSKFLVEVACYQ